MQNVLSFRDLDAWHAAMDLVLSTYDLCGRFPADEKYELVRQMRRAAVSVPSNIAEGHANGPGRRYRHHVRIALGSLGELATQLEVAIRLKYVTAEAGTEMSSDLARTRQLLHGIRRSLNRRLIGQGLACVALMSAAGLCWFL
jgi:four helix bundle protein